MNGNPKTDNALRGGDDYSFNSCPVRLGVSSNKKDGMQSLIARNNAKPVTVTRHKTGA